MQMVFTKNANEKVKELMSKYPDIEWFGLIYGEKNNNKIIVNRIHIPHMEKQEVAWVETKYILIKPKIKNDVFLGYIHSHHNMGAYFSKEDLKQFDQVDIAVIVSHRNIIAKIKKNNKIEDVEKINFENYQEGIINK